MTFFSVFLPSGRRACPVNNLRPSFSSAARGRFSALKEPPGRSLCPAEARNWRCVPSAVFGPKIHVSTFGRSSRSHPRAEARPTTSRVFDNRLCSPYPVLSIAPPGICAVRSLRPSEKQSKDCPSRSPRMRRLARQQVGFCGEIEPPPAIAACASPGICTVRWLRLYVFSRREDVRPPPGQSKDCIPDWAMRMIRWYSAGVSSMKK